jgi:ABC-2 type transport system ATP-binding protein
MGTVISVEHLRKTYRDTLAVDDVSFEVEEGQIFGILGPNGAGKTTTIECVQGVKRWDRGKVRVLGLDPATDIVTLRRHIGSQLQDSALPDRMRVWEALDLFASLGRNGHPWKRVMREWGLTSKRNSTFVSLSGGQRQRLFVALALVNDPQVVFLDEMTTGLDVAARRVAWDLIRKVRDRGKTVVLVTHFMDEAEILCDNIVVIDHGRVVARGSPQSLIKEHGKGVRISFSVPKADLTWLKDIPHVYKVKRYGNYYEIEGIGPAGTLVASALVEHGLVPEDYSVKQAALEEVFLGLTTHEVEEET